MHINNQRIMAGSSAWHDVVHIQKTAQVTSSADGLVIGGGGYSREWISKEVKSAAVTT